MTMTMMITVFYNDSSLCLKGFKHTSRTTTGPVHRSRTDRATAATHGQSLVVQRALLPLT